MMRFNLRPILQLLICAVVLHNLEIFEAAGISKQDVEELHLSIPWPSGIIVDHVESAPGSNTYYRFGRLQHNAVAIRPDWQPIREVSHVLTNDHCRSLIRRAEEYADKRSQGWNSTRHVDYQIRPVNDVDVGEMLSGWEDELQALLGRLHSSVLRAMAETWKLEYSQLVIDDLFINKYNASDPNQQKLGLAPHHDKTLFSFVIPLNSAFEGGGTLFPLREELHTPAIGAALFFSGQHLHAGHQITSGVRYVLAGFCRYGDAKGGFFMPPHPLYLAAYDGYAAQAGFRFGDLIVGLEECTMVPEEQHSSADVADTQKATQEPLKIIMRMHVEMQAVLPTMPRERWVELAQSCEKHNPGQPVSFLVRREREREGTVGGRGSEQEL